MYDKFLNDDKYNVLPKNFKEQINSLITLFEKENFKFIPKWRNDKPKSGKYYNFIFEYRSSEKLNIITIRFFSYGLQIEVYPEKTPKYRFFDEEERVAMLNRAKYIFRLNLEQRNIHDEIYNNSYK